MSKHLGHALEGFISGLLRYLSARRSSHHVRYEVRRSLGGSLSMDTDLVVYRVDDAGEKALALCAVFHSLRQNNSDMKWKRSRQEYVESETLRARGLGQALHEDFHTVMCVFGHEWKQQLLSDFRDNMPPAFIAAGLLSVSQEQKLFKSVEELYWTMPSKNRTELLAESVADRPFAFAGSKLVAQTLEKLVWDTGAQSPSPLIRRELRRVAGVRPATRVSKAFSTRYNHGLSLLALFPASERSALFSLYRRPPFQPEQLPPHERSALLRGLFIGVVRLHAAPSVGRGGKLAPMKVVFHKKRSVADADFSFVFERMTATQAEEIVGGLLSLARTSPRSFQGAVSSLRMGNWRDVIDHGLPILRALAGAATSGDWADVQSKLSADCALRPESAVWSDGSDALMLRWSIGVATAVVAAQDRELAKVHEFARTRRPSSKEIGALIRSLRSIPKPILASVVRASRTWLEALRDENWTALGELSEKRASWLTSEDTTSDDEPAIFSLFVPSSWLQWQYNILSTHPCFSPTLWTAYSRLALAEHEAQQLVGFPKKRSAAIREVLSGHDGRAQFGIIALTEGGVVTYEGKSVTENHVGDKSKELLDRVAEIQRAATDADRSIETVIVLDGDFSQEALAELSAPGRYNRIYSMNELIEGQ